MSTILLVDDDPTFLSTLECLLDGAGYDVLCASDGSAAKILLEKEHRRIDLAIVDLALPVVNGFELIGSIARRPGPMRIIATTAVYKDYHLDLVRSLGAHAVIRKPAPGKPIPEHQWLETIKRLIGGASSPEAASGSEPTDPQMGTDHAKGT